MKCKVLLILLSAFVSIVNAQLKVDRLVVLGEEFHGNNEINKGVIQLCDSIHKHNEIDTILIEADPFELFYSTQNEFGYAHLYLEGLNSHLKKNFYCLGIDTRMSSSFSKKFLVDSITNWLTLRDEHLIKKLKNIVIEEFSNSVGFESMDSIIAILELKNLNQLSFQQSYIVENLIQCLNQIKIESLSSKKYIQYRKDKMNLNISKLLKHYGFKNCIVYGHLGHFIEDERFFKEISITKRTNIGVMTDHCFNKKVVYNKRLCYTPDLIKNKYLKHFNHLNEVFIVD